MPQVVALIPLKWEASAHFDEVAATTEIELLHIQALKL